MGEERYPVLSMSHPPFSPEMSVPEALSAARAITGIFIAQRTACVGCPLARFCTLGDVANNYSLPLEAFLAKLEQAALADRSHSLGAHHEKPD
jgi:hypothetical protein